MSHQEVEVATSNALALAHERSVNSHPRRRRTNGLAALGLAVVLGASGTAFAENPPKASGSLDEGQVGDIEAIVRQYLLDHPEVVLEALKKLQAQEEQAAQESLRSSAGGVKPVTAEDHVFGNRSAPVKLIEFSDFECPFCKGFHSTVKQVMAEYGKSGQVAWVYRHFPLDNLHSKARKEAQASECANELGGNDAFWAFTDALFEIAPSNNRLDLARLPEIAEKVGLDRGKFEACLSGDQNGGKYASHIEENYQDATASGGTGTPYTIIVDAKGKVYPITGAQSYAAIKAIIDVALKP
jgi:protein-disulfide isomerase